MKEKINWLLILKAWAMFLVIVGHSLMYPPGDPGNPNWINHLYFAAKSFRMPLFVFSSGFLFYYSRLKRSIPYGTMLLDKLKRLGIPFVVLTLFAMVLKTIFSGYMARPSEISIGEFVNAVLYPYDGPMREFWFIILSMWLFILFPLFKYLLANNKRTIFGCIFFMVLSAIVPKSLFGDLLCLGTTLRYIIWFYLGMVCCKYEIFNKKRNNYLLFCILLTLYMCLYIFCSKSLSVLISFVGILMSIEFAFILDKNCPKIFSSFRNYTYQIYLIGIFIQIFVKIGYKHSLYPYMPSFVLCIIVGLYLPVIISKIVEKINWAPLLLSIGLSKKK